MDIRKMTFSDISAVCRIHERVLPTATARMGLLPFFYKTIIDNSDLHVAIVATENSRVIGAITATRDAHQTKRALFKPWLILPAVMTGRVSIHELIDRIRTERSIMAIANPYQTILTLVVDTKHHRKGVGKKLVSSVKLNGTVYADTEHAFAFYTRCGFRFLKKIRKSTIAVKTLKSAP